MLLRVPKLLYIPKRFVQALYVSGEKSQGNTRILTPILDFEQRLANRTVLETNLNRRKLLNSLNLDDLFAQWEIYKSIKIKRDNLQNRQKQVSNLLKEAKKSKDIIDKENLIRKYTIEGETLKDDLQNLIKHSSTMEDAFINMFLDIPNDILDNVPNELQVVQSNGKKCVEQRSHHLSYEHAIDFYDQYSYFLKGDAALVDGILPLNCVDYFRKNGFIQFNNPDFANTVMIEGAGYTVDDVYEVKHDLDMHHKNVIHLVGNGSMLSYLGFITKMRVAGTLLPLQWISAGKTYLPITSNDYGLFNVSQSTTVQVFLAGTEEQMQQKFNDTFELIIKLFNLLNVHYRIVNVPANELNAAECFSMRIECFSPHFNKYFTIGHLCNYSDFIGKRLLFSYENDLKNRNLFKFTHIVSGTICNITRLIAILLETNHGIIPDNSLFK